MSPRPMVRLGNYDQDTPYRIFAGLVFQPLTLQYLWLFENLPEALSRFIADPTVSDYEMLVPERVPAGRREIVVLTGVLRAEMTRGYEQFEDQIIFAVDGTPVRDLKHLSQLLDHGTGRLTTITMQRGGMIAVRRSEAATLGPEILTRYQVGKDRSPGLGVPARYKE